MTPRFLHPGDTIGIVATARWISPEQLQPALDLFSLWGFNTRAGRYVSEKHNQLAGNDEQRLEDLQQMLDDPAISAIVIARGGYGTVRIVDRIDWTRFNERPKWICGYSDITVLLNELSNRGIACIHSTMPVSFPDATPEALEQLHHALSGHLSGIRWVSGQVVPGRAQGEVVGGNLSVLCSQLGSRTQLKANAVILFIEDVDEMLYHVDRMMFALKRSGIMSNISGVIIGGFTQIKDNTKEFGFSANNPWGFDIREILMSYFKPLGIPLAFDFPAGHLSDNRAFYMGRTSELIVSEGEVILNFKE